VRLPEDHFAHPQPDDLAALHPVFYAPLARLILWGLDQAMAGRRPGQNGQDKKPTGGSAVRSNGPEKKDPLAGAGQRVVRNDRTEWLSDAAKMPSP
jgi:hypothetical protein